MGYNSTYDAGDIDDAATDLIIGTADSLFNYVSIIGFAFAVFVVLVLWQMAKQKELAS